MCLAVPAQLTEIDGFRGKASVAGNIVKADLSLLDEPVLGDWVLIHAGCAIEKLEPEDAAAILEALEQACLLTDGADET